MLKFSKKVKSLTFTLCCLSMIANTLSLNAYETYPTEASDSYYDENCCEPYPETGSYWNKNNLLILGGAILLGAAAGAGAGAAVASGRDHHSHHRANGGFDIDEDQTLTFLFDANIVSAELGNSVITFFVSTPDGRVFETNPITITALGPQPQASIEIHDPVFGEYITGINSIAPKEIMMTLTKAVVISSSGSTANYSSNVVLVLPIGESHRARDGFVYCPK